MLEKKRWDLSYFKSKEWITAGKNLKKFSLSLPKYMDAGSAKATDHLITFGQAVACTNKF